MSKQIFGILGEKLGHSLSPDIHDEIFKAYKMDACYKKYETEKERLADTIKEFEKNGVRGVNVTIPYKVDVIKYLDSVSDEAKGIGAVNTVNFENGIKRGYNTDYFGFGAMLKRYDIPVNNKKAVILGTGGASKAVAKYLIDSQISDILYVSRQSGKANDFGIKVIDYNELYGIKNFDMIVNCTPVGMYPNIGNSPVSKDVLMNYDTAVDIIYNPLETEFIRQAKKSGLKGINGLYMLVYQAVKSENIWNNITVNDIYVDKIVSELAKRMEKSNG